MQLKFNTLTNAGLLSTLLLVTPHALAAKVDIYGTIQLSADYITGDNAENTEDIAVASNSSRLGFKGEHALAFNITALWQLENGIDVSGETGSISARDRFLGLSHQYGTLLMGIHDTPHKTLGEKVDLMPYSIADRRAMLGLGVVGSTSTDIRARNATMYISPTLFGLEARIMQTTGNDTQSTGDSNSVTSASLVYDNKSLYAGASYERQREPSVDTTGIRVAAGLNTKSLSLNAIYEIMISDTNDEYDRPAYGASIAYKISDTTLKAQGFLIGDYQEQADSNASLFALGISQKMAKNTEINLLFAFNNNADRARTSLGGKAHGETYTPNFGESLRSTSLGITYKF